MKTLQSEFLKGVKSGKFPHPQNTQKAILSVVSKSTMPLLRAYWSGYLCQISLDDPDALNNHEH